MPLRVFPVALLTLIAALPLAGCRRSVDLVAALEPVDVVTGWYDAGIVEGRNNKLVPSVSLKLRNKASEPLRSVQIYAVFRRVGEPEGWGEHFGWAVQRNELAPGQQTAELVLRSERGYTGEEPRLRMLQNSQFVDAKVELFLKQASQDWSRLAEYPIQRQLLTQ